MNTSTVDNRDSGPTSAIALLVPCYNAAAFLPRLLGAVQAQTVPFAEVICYDDGSTDDTVEVALMSGARVVRGQRNRGVSFARNALLEASTSPWVHFHDADDVLSDRFVEVMSRYTENERMVTFCGARKVALEDRANVEAGQCKTYDGANETNDYVAFFLRQFVHLNVAIFPAATLQQVGGFCPYLRIGEDMDMMVRLAASGLSFRSIPDILVTRFDHNASLTKRTDSLRQWRSALHYLNRCRRLLPTRYHETLGEKALYYARCFYWDDQICDARRAVHLARRCGVTVPPNISGWQGWVARCFGVEALFWMLKQRAKRKPLAESQPLETFQPLAGPRADEMRNEPIKKEMWG